MTEADGMPTAEQIDVLYKRLDEEAEAAGYHLNPEVQITRGLVEGLLINESRYGYWACPCRLADGEKKQDLDIICPCDYRDADLTDYGACYCSLYVSEAIAEGQAKATSIPERRPDDPAQRPQFKSASAPTSDELKIWRCRVCGYLCAREKPPGRCPVCKAERERFEPLDLRVQVRG